ncbi:hypothetical protein HK101_005893 [Irineochytrium annulatum]|nr:hypothetical protein HK101_005893 [Irineochytrium annulatum]
MACPAGRSIKAAAVPNEVVIDILYENQRGCYVHMGDPIFSAEALLPTDRPPWCDLQGKVEVDRMLYPTPPNWEWVTDWTLEMAGSAEVDPDGWSYSHHFGHKNWTGQCGLTHYVRRRAWSRTRRRTGYDVIGPNGAAVGTDSVAETAAKLTRLPSLLRRCSLDRQKLDLVRSTVQGVERHLKVHNVIPILNEFQFEKNLTEAAKLVAFHLAEEDFGQVLKLTKYLESRRRLRREYNERRKEG